MTPPEIADSGIVELPYEQYFDAMPCYLSVQDKNLRIVKANSKFTQDFGDYTGRYCYQIYKHRPEKCEDCPVERTFRDGERHTSEEQVRCLSGQEVSVIVYTTPIRNEEGEITHVMEMSTDITLIKALETQLRESQERYRDLFEDVPTMISIQDDDLNIIDANRVHREKFGSFYGCKCYQVYKHRSEECYPCTVRSTFEDGEVHEHEEVVTAQDGTNMNVLVHTAPIRDQAGNINSVIEMSTDITRIRELQDKLSSIGMLISSISHGIKGLLNGMGGGIYLVNSGLQKNDNARLEQGWEIVQRNVGRIKSMVLDILYYAKDRDPDWQSVDPAELIGEIKEILQVKAKELGIRLDTAIDQKIESMEADRNALRAALVNLAENSLDACRVDSSGEDHWVEIRLGAENGSVVFKVSDNGIGMDQETREKALSLFFSSKGTEGTGLGLFIANKIAVAHGGSLTLASELEMGTVFTMKLPLKRPATETKLSE